MFRVPSEKEDPRHRPPVFASCPEERKCGGIFLSVFFMLKKKMLPAAVLLAFLSLPASAADPVMLLFGHRAVLAAETAQTSAELETGLMHRKTLGENAGMLFVFPRADSWCMWMKNTEVALSVAFISETGHVISTENMTPQSLDLHCSVLPARYAAEAASGWFQKHGIKPGDPVSGIPGVRH